MANIVELRDMSDDKLEEMLENSREEMFNLRFQQASARLEDYSRLKHVRREIAQLETVLHMRQLAVETAVSESTELANFLQGQSWNAVARYVYEDAAYQVEFTDESGNSLGSALVDLNKKRVRSRKARSAGKTPRMVTRFEIAG
ncbi:MAG: 50S ribosomal protein L29 [Anaerolineales bacterium]|nr:50S ribosomal protein L29 [Anaerolineales bacterium]